MDLLDVIVVFSAISAAVGGWRLGFVARVTSWLGLALGVAIASAILLTAWVRTAQALVRPVASTDAHPGRHVPLTEPAPAR